MNLRRSIASLLLLAACGPAAVAQGSTAQKLASLRNLRDTGVISQADYQQRVAALQGGSAGGVGTASAAQHGAANGPHTDPRHLGLPTTAHTVSDPQWGIPWGTVKLPPNWTLNAQMVHAGANGCTAIGHGPLLVMESPDKTVGLTIFPVLKSSWMQGPGFNMQQMQRQGCFVMPSTHAADFVTRVLLPKVHNGARFQVVSSAADPMQEGMARQIRDFNAHVQPLQGMNFQNQRSVETARVFARVEDNGRPMMEMVSLTLSCEHTRFRQVMANMPAMETADCTAWNVILGKMPDDGSDPTKVQDDPSVKPFFAIQQNPAWAQRLQQVTQQENAAMQQQTNAIAAAGRTQIAEAGKRADAMRDASNARSDAIMNNYRNHTAAMDKVQQGQIDYLSSSHDYHDTTTGQVVNLSNQYNHTYFDGKGHALQTDSAYSPGVDWTEAGH